MKVKELKELLNEVNDESEVLLSDSEFGDHYLKNVKVTEYEVHLT